MTYKVSDTGPRRVFHVNIAAMVTSESRARLQTTSVTVFQVLRVVPNFSILLKVLLQNHIR